jgi:sugar phosphate permease
MLAHLLAPALMRRGIHYGWVMAGITFLIMLSTAAAMGLPGVLIEPLRGEFSWQIGDISGALALRLVLFGLVAPFAAALIARFGILKVVGVGLLLIVTGVALATRMDRLWQLWLSWGLMVGLGTGLTALVLGATVASRWFTHRRGLVMGLLTASNATGQLLFLPMDAWLVDHAGWRMAVLPPLLACALAWLLMVLFGRDHPAQVGQPPYGETEVLPLPARPTSNPFTTSLQTLREAAGDRTFWVLFGTFFVCGLSTNGLVQSHFIPFCVDYGLTAVAGASVLAMMGMFDFFGTIASGWLSDRYDIRWLLFMYYGLRGLSLIALPYSSFTFFGLSLFAMFYGLDWVATVPPTVKLAAANFGRERAALVFGWVFTAHQLGAAVAAAGAGMVRDGTGSYLPAFLAAGVACLFAAIAALSPRKPVFA